MSLQIGQYRVVSELGAGGMGVVYRAVDVQINRDVALKRLRSEFAASPAVLERFRREAQLQGRLNHPNIAQLYSMVQTHDAFCLVMELVDGISLKDLLPLQWRQAAAILIQVLDALGYALPSDRRRSFQARGISMPASPIPAFPRGQHRTSQVPC